MDSSLAPTSIQRKTDPVHTVSPSQQQPIGEQPQPTDSIVTAPDSSPDSHESEPCDAVYNDTDVLFGVNPDPYIRTKIREGLRPLRRKFYGETSVANKSEASSTAKGPRRNSIFASFNSTKGYVSALLVSHGGIERSEAQAFAVDLTRQITFDRALKERPQAARLSMIKELTQAIKFKTFHEVHFKDLTYEERKKILNSTTAYKEKFLPSGEFDKSKSRLLAGGHICNWTSIAESRLLLRRDWIQSS